MNFCLDGYMFENDENICSADFENMLNGVRAVPRLWDCISTEEG